ncbi:hypothetical protein LCGC14_2751930, partial [marine sediment metagenome]
MTDREHIARLRHLLIDAKDMLYVFGLTRNHELVQRIYAGLDAEQPKSRTAHIADSPPVLSIAATTTGPVWAPPNPFEH